MQEQLLTVPEVARRLRVSRATAYSLTASGEIPTIRLGRSVRVDPDDLSRFIARSRRPDAA